VESRRQTSPSNLQGAVISAPVTPLTVTLGFAKVVVSSPSTIKIFEAVSVTAPVLVTVRVVPTVVAPKVVAWCAPVVLVVSVVPTVPDTFNAPAAVSEVAPLLSRMAVKAPMSLSVIALPSAVTAPPKRSAACERDAVLHTGWSAPLSS